MEDFRHPVMPCPYCGSPNDVATGPAERDPIAIGPPTPGSLIVCILCACPAFITEELELRRLTTFELKRVITNRDVIVAIVSSIIGARASDVGDGVPKLRFIPPEER